MRIHDQPARLHNIFRVCFAAERRMLLLFLEIGFDTSHHIVCVVLLARWRLSVQFVCSAPIVLLQIVYVRRSRLRLLLLGIIL